MSDKTYDAIVLGAGPAGEVVAGRLADAGWKVAIVEKDLVGGECSYYACMPSKALLRPADVLAEAKRIPGVPVGDDAGSTRRRSSSAATEAIHDEDDSGQLPWLEERGIDLFRGAGRFVGAGRIAVGDDELAASRAVIVATGSGAAMPPIDGLDSVRAWNNRDATTAKRVPASMIVLGGGPVGSELSQAWASLGTKVTLVEAGPHLLGREEPFAGEEVAAALRGRFGVDVRVGDKVESVRAGGAGVIAELKDGGAVEGEEILVAVGRKPHTDDLGLDAIGVEPDEHGFLEVDDRMRVGGDATLYAIGDVNGRGLFTHVGKYQAWIVAENLLGREAERGRRRPRLAPRHLHRPAGRGGRQDAGPGRRGGDRRPRGRGPHRRLARRQLPGQGHRRHVAAGRRPGQGDDRRRHLHRLRDRRLPPGGDDRDRRRGAAGAPAPRDRPLPHAQ